jgi:hypothetical protein
MRASAVAVKLTGSPLTEEHEGAPEVPRIILWRLADMDQDPYNVTAPAAGAKITTEQQEAIYGSSAALVDNIVANVNAFKAIPDPATVVPSTK